MIRAVIFDMDGLIIDTEWPDFQSWQEIYERHGVAITPEEWTVQVGLRGGAFHPAAELVRRCGRDLDCERLRREYRRRYHEILDADFSPRPGFRALLGLLIEEGYARAIASAAARDWVHYVVRRLEIGDALQAVVTGDDVERGKPHPDVYLAAAARLGIAPGECLALEDSAPGIAAARAAGMRCVAVPNPLTRYQELSGADCQVASLEAITLAFLRRF